MDEIVVEYRLTPEDAAAAGKYLAKRLLGPRWLLVLVPFFAVGGFLFFLGPDGQAQPGKATRPGWESLAAFFTPAVIFLLFIFVLGPRLAARSMRASSRRPGWSNWLGLHRLTVTPESFTIAADLTTVTSRWDVVQKVETTDKYVFLFTGPNAAHIIPRRAFSDEDEADAFVATVKRYCCQITR